MSAWGFLFRPTDSATGPCRHHHRHQQPRVVMKDYRPGNRASGTHRVGTRDTSGAVLRFSGQSAAVVPDWGGVRYAYWDDLDFAYFSGYAMWTYRRCPACCCAGGKSIDRFSRTPTARRSRPSGFPITCPHSPTQDAVRPSGRLVRRLHRPVWWARGPGPLSAATTAADGLWLPTCRRVCIRGGRRAGRSRRHDRGHRHPFGQAGAVQLGLTSRCDPPVAIRAPAQEPPRRVVPGRQMIRWLDTRSRCATSVSR